ncbi:GntR family transcriptional regulator [Nocardiopsis tropica]|uniref:GntR family transcriptional regulator n=1 Tax=Nocardiopsis tropica TaxID=109330 RepID=A0ABV1ZMJ1_9ACTN
MSGDLAPGGTLPSEAALVRQYDVSRGTARQALSALEATGLVIAVHGRGRFVQGPETPTGWPVTCGTCSLDAGARARTARRTASPSPGALLWGSRTGALPVPAPRRC